MTFFCFNWAICTLHSWFQTEGRKRICPMVLPAEDIVLTPFYYRIPKPDLRVQVKNMVFIFSTILIFPTIISTKHWLEEVVS